MTYKHIQDVSVMADFATENDILYRYRLEITKDDVKSLSKTVCVIMQNPSYANEHDADKSVQFLEKNVFERDLPEFDGVGRLIVVNQFARVQTADFVGLPLDVGSRNDEAIRCAISQSEIVVIAWGSTNGFDSRKRFVLDLIEKMKDKEIYKTNAHPSRASYAGFIQPFDVS